jgi:hypothetical protein
MRFFYHLEVTVYYEVGEYVSENYKFEYYYSGGDNEIMHAHVPLFRRMGKK